MEDKYFGEGICGGLMAISTIAQTNEYLQMIQIIICSVAAAIGLALTIFKFVLAYRKAKKDGVIDSQEKKELTELGEQIVSDTKKVAEQIDEIKEITKHE